MDARCGITGLLQDAETAPCTDLYTNCQVWRKEKKKIWSGYLTRRATRAPARINSGTGEWEDA